MIDQFCCISPPEAAAALVYLETESFILVLNKTLTATTNTETKAHNEKIINAI